ncbi:SDR family oxidoreductase [Vibrio parahaemolyticus]|uniref:NAD-dependent epimerase/dehydratase family protein n=1 Tax=Vibrio parahaemolyticus TaxID=670 RepID=UPI000A3BD860|nr:SDR family oxidoreductase [Vibrio parahaemolyticus]EHH2567853.1 SDR family oxidoreductase [Vibrio parahaemolyticus]OUJ36398.1 dTDP-glucose 4,6-dehydratase [Vibrio parahaemolyticus]
MERYTVFGGSGFIGSEFVSKLSSLGHDVHIVKREDPKTYEDNLGIVIFAAGYGDCNTDPKNVIDANVSLISEIVSKAKYSKLVYISSTRVYLNSNNTQEDSDVIISNSDVRSLFNLTKLSAEQLILKLDENSIIIRPSNVYGKALNSNLFLPSIIRSAINEGNIKMFVTEMYEKDYVSVENVVNSTLSLIYNNSKGIFNVAYGSNTSAKDIAYIIQSETGCNVEWLVENDEDYFHPIDVSKLKNEIDFKPEFVLNDLKKMIDCFKNIKIEI